ncbi:MAG TPA: hypothetical protein VHB79_37540 [Polyangiaceae bacterium]|nr:hypothetical protein [Polyangiaceae bacterium]
MKALSLLLVTVFATAACSGSENGVTPGAGGAGQAGSMPSAGGGAANAGSAGTTALAAAAGAGGSAGAAGRGGASTAGSGGAAGAGGAGGASGGSGGAAPSLVLPITRGELDVLEFGGIAFAVNPSKGARIVSFKLDGDELLTDTTANPNYYGSTLWTSPASDWVVPGTFVPPPVVDGNPYTVTASEQGVITATSATSTANGKQFVVSKIFHADLAHQAIVIDYGLENTGAAPFRLSHWEVTRVFPNGLMFFATGGTPKLDFLKQPVQVQQAAGYTWYDNSTHKMGQGESKAGTDSPSGFIAQVAPHPAGDLLFIKAFSPVASASAPPDHYPIEFYCNDPHTYVELEDHSSYDEIAPGATYTRTVTWYVRRLPSGTDRSIGSAALIAAALSAMGK